MTWNPEHAVVLFALLLAAGAIWLLLRARAARERAEASATTYRRGARWLRRLLDANPSALVVIDGESNVLLWSRAAEDLFGWPEREVLGLPVPMITTDKLGEWKRIRDVVLAGNSIYGLETTERARDGRLLSVALSAIPIGREIILAFGTPSAVLEEPIRAQAAAQI
jgi:PAS domain S-box-containing protein